MLPLPSPSRPATGAGHYLRDLVYGALDGCITTFAVVAAVAGAALGPRVAIVLGLGNLVADGISMAASNYLGLKSELEQVGRPVAQEKPWRHAVATFAAFVATGAIPLVAFLVPAPAPIDPLAAAALVSMAVLASVGAARSRFVKAKPAWRQGLEMLLVGVAAGGAAYAIGAMVQAWLGASVPAVP